MDQKKNIKMNVSDGIEFFSHETAVNFSPIQFILDFKCITPRVDMRARDGPVIVMRHNIVMMDPYHAKQVRDLLNDSIEKYEKEFGEIKRPKPVEKAAKKATKARDKQNKQQKQKKSVKGSAKKSPSYLG
ncbi:DUF3467 domain-containing protein [Candidatus Woesearchaeota archaeon]|jgi:hypothetical protein|nr:DUF3467 domain-containing protein [Candidatus Woesearchaeota archaeon]MBT6518682.1 DUF3467 domain-containing protein [Candidatus Woesearchaeota archaeon]MBT7368871.1 DUF3467 domain-containing protein [Candidatus Woesearchaeota archaeon]